MKILLKIVCVCSILGLEIYLWKNLINFYADPSFSWRAFHLVCLAYAGIFLVIFAPLSLIPSKKGSGLFWGFLLFGIGLITMLVTSNEPRSALIVSGMVLVWGMLMTAGLVAIVMLICNCKPCTPVNLKGGYN